MKILRSYVIREFIGPLFIALAVLTVVMLLGNLIKIADLVINKGVDIYSVSKVFVYLIPFLLSYTLPVAALVAALLAFGRLSSDNEIIAIRASGINVIKLIFPLLIIALILSLILVVFNDRVIPYAHYASRKTLVDVGIKNPTAALEPGIFINSFDKYVLFIYHIEGNKLYNVRIYEPKNDDRPTRTIVARKGEFIPYPEKGMVKLKLMDGTSDEVDPDNPELIYKMNFKTYFMNLNIAAAQDKEDVRKKPKDMTIAELKNEITSLKRSDIDATPYISEIHRKLSLSFSCFVFVLLGSSLAMLTRRREKSINFGLAFVIAGIYYLMLIGSEALCLRGILEPHIALWIPNVALGLVGGLFTLKICAS